MFRVLDDRRGSHAAVSVPRPGPLRLYAHVRASADPADLTGLRVLLTADLIFRAAELGGLQVLATWVLPGEAAGQDSVERAAAALGVHPPAVPAADLAKAWPGGPGDVHVADDGADVPEDRGGILVCAAATRLAKDACPGETAAGSPGECDPLTIRLALMAVPRHQAAVLTAGHLADAARTLRAWRRQVARWAESPSAAIPAPIAAMIRSAIEEGQDITAVLALLSGLAADETVSPGALFETFVYADRVLGLDLPRDIGR